MKCTANIYQPPVDNLIRFWRSEVKVTAGQRGGEVIHVDDGVDIELCLCVQVS